MIDEQEAAQRKLEFCQREYWRMRNQKQRFMRCPYCSPPETKFKDYKRNWMGRNFCCFTFAAALKAIIDRQDEIDKGMKMAGMVQNMMQGSVN